MEHKYNKIKEKFKELIQIFDPKYKKNPDMKDTPNRLTQMYLHFFRNDSPLKHFKKVFPTKNDELVIVKNIECFGLCPHHFLPIIYKVHIGYIPKGKAIGLSKLARVATDLASYPKLQENFTVEIGDLITKKLRPLGSMVVVDGIHGCMRCRGVEQTFSSTVTSDCRGVMRDKPPARAEFLNLIQLKNGQ